MAIRVGAEEADLDLDLRLAIDALHEERAARALERGERADCDLGEATRGVECRKDADVIDEIPMAYKDIDAVMAAQQDLVEVVYTLKQVVCVKG